MSQPTSRAPALRKVWSAPRYPGRSTITASPRSIRQRASRSSPCCAPASTRMCSRLAAEAVRQRRAEPRHPLGRPVTPGGVARASRARRSSPAGRRRSGSSRAPARRRRATRAPGSAACAHQIAHRRVGRLQRRRGDLAAPGERRARRVRPRRHERAAPDVAAHQPPRLELAVGADDRGAADAKRRGEIALGRQADAGRQRRRARSRARAASPAGGRAAASAAATCASTPSARNSPFTDWLV